MKFELSLAIDFLFKKTFGRMKYFQTFMPDIDIIGNSETLIMEFLHRELERAPAGDNRLKFLDVGAEDSRRKHYAQGYDYVAIDINPTSPEVLAGDICSCPHIESDSFDVVFSLDVLEHIKRPWEAVNECIRLTKPGGLLIHRTIFSYRYHPIPIDYWRFSSQCLEYLFTDSGRTRTLIKGYDLRGRRRNRLGYALDSRPPIDWMGGFRENWQVLWIGRKLESDAAVNDQSNE